MNDPVRPTSQFHWIGPRLAWCVAGALLASFVGTSLWGAWQDSVTVDEFNYPAVGLYYLRTGDFLLDAVNPPLTRELGAIPLLLSGASLDLSPEWHAGASGWEPWLLGTKFMADNAERYLTLFFLARLFPIALGVLLGVFVFVWSKAMWGVSGGLLSLLLYVLCPNVLAHSRLVTADIAVTCFIFLTCYCLWKLLRSPRWRLVVALGLCIGLAFGSKFSALLLVVIVPLQAAVLLAAYGNRLGALLKGRTVAASLVALVLVVSVTTVTVDTVYGFRGMFVPLGKLEMGSPILRGAARLAPWLPTPLPRAFLMGLDLKAQEAGRGGYPGFLFGQWAEAGWRSFYAMSLLIKLPIGVLMLAAMSLLWWRRGWLREQWSGVAMAWIPIVVFVVLATLLFYRFNYGLRYILPVLPFVHLASGRVGKLAESRRGAFVVAGSMAAWCIYAAVTIFPHHLSYFNEFVGGSKNGFKCMVDSNLDWGQDLRELKAYMDRRGLDRISLAYFGHVSPKLYGIDFVPLARGDRPAGTIAVSATLLQGMPYPITYEADFGRMQHASEFLRKLRAVRPDDFAWLRSRTPSAMAGYSILIFEPEKTDHE